jgi:hypothetical protein
MMSHDHRRDATSSSIIFIDMLSLARLVLLFIIVMTAIKCPGCKKTFETNGGLSTHMRHCKTRITAVTKQILEQHRDSGEPLLKRTRFGKRNVGEEETVTAGETVQSVGEGSVQATDEGSGMNDSEPVEPEAPPVRICNTQGFALFFIN